MHTRTLFMLIFLVMPFTRLFAQNEIFLEDGSTLVYTALETRGKLNDVTATVNNEREAILKTKILGYTNPKGKLYTYNLKSGKKWRVKVKGSPNDPCNRGSIHAAKYFKVKDQAINPYLGKNMDTDESACYNQAAKQIRTRNTVGIVVFVIVVSSLLSTLAQI